MVVADSDALWRAWLETLSGELERSGMSLPRIDRDGRSAAAALGGRNGRHGPEWQQQWDEMTSVYRLDPAATW
jgi:hypothetical protein